MKKVSIITLFIIGCINSAYAQDLDELLSNQEHTTLTTVQYQANIIVNASRSSASMVCQSLGFTRLVAFTSDIKKGNAIDTEKVVNTFSESGVISFKVTDKLPSRSYHTFTSVTCAK